MTRISAAILRMACWIAGVLLFGVLTACGGGSESSTPTVHQPTIANLAYTPTSAMQAAGATATISGTFAFHDAGADIASVRITSSGGADVVTPTPQLGGIAAGTAIGQVLVPLDQPGRYTFEVWVTDSTGYSSNRLAGTFEVVAVTPPPSHAPAISALSYSPAAAYQSIGGTTPVTASVQFGDSGGDVVVLHLTTGNLDLTVSTFGLAGSTSGTATGTFQVPVSTIGKQDFEVWAADGNGAASNRLVGTFEVLAPPVIHAPVVSNLRLSPAAVYQGTGTVPLTATVDFADSGGDIASFRVWTSNGAENTVTGSYPAAGTATLTLPVPIDSVGTFIVQVWATDSKGTTSPAVLANYEVLAPDAWLRLPFVPPGFLFDIAWNGTRYVAVGEGIAITSLDLSTWTVKSLPPSAWMSSVVGTPGRFIAVGGDGSQAMIMSTTDGNSWNEVFRMAAPGGSWLNKVIWAGTQYVAVGYENPVSADVSYALFLTSPDGVTWTQRATRLFQTGNFWGGSLRAVAWSGSVFVATGEDATYRPVVWRSLDGVTWTQEAQLPGASPLEDYDVAWGNGRFVAVGPANGNGNPTFVSTDGITWQTGTATIGHEMWSVGASPNLFLGLGWDARQSSADGLHWTAYPMTGCNGRVTWDGARFISVGEYICKSP